jgi:hypothetical protein
MEYFLAWRWLPVWELNCFNSKEVGTGISLPGRLSERWLCDCGGSVPRTPLEKNLVQVRVRGFSG